MARVRDAMTRELVTMDASCSVGEAATMMARRRVGSVLVLEDGALAGIFTERDIVRALSQDTGAPAESLADWMTRDPVTISPDADLEEARRRMLEGHFRHLPVEEEGRPVGMLSMRDLARASASDSQQPA